MKKSPLKKQKVYSIIFIILVAFLAFLFLKPFFKEKTAAMGDSVDVVYTLFSKDGQIIESSNNKPAHFILGESGKSSVFDQAIEGMKKGERRKVLLRPASASIRQITINRSQEFEQTQYLRRYKSLTYSQFKDLFRTEPKEDEILNLNSSPWDYRIFKVYSNGNVTLQIMAKPGQKVILPELGIPATVVNVSVNLIYIQLEPEAGQVIVIDKGNYTFYREGDSIFMKINVNPGDKISLEGQAYEVTDVTLDSIIAKPIIKPEEQEYHLDVELVGLKKK